MSDRIANWLEISPWPKPKGVLRSFAEHLFDHVVPHERNGFKPHVLSERALALFAAFLCVVKVVTISAAILGPVSTASSAAITIQSITTLTNDARKQAGVQSLKLNDKLTRAAQMKAEDMLANAYFAHTSPTGVTPWDWFAKSGYSYRAAGENLAVNFTDDKAVVDAWLQSPGHRANMLNSTFSEIGIGISTGPFEGHIATFVVQTFGLPIGSEIPKAPSNTIKKTLPAKPKQEVRDASVPKEVPIEESAGELTPPAADFQVSVEEGKLKVNADFNQEMEAVSVKYNNQTFSLENVSANTWQGTAPASDLSGGAVILNATTKNGQSFEEKIAQVEPSITEAFGANASTENISMSPAWQKLQNSERVIYPALIASLLTVVFMSILIRRHVHHVRMIANASFVVILASLLWMM